MTTATQMDEAALAMHIDQYVAGKLSGQELDEFEDYLLDHPQVMLDVQAAKWTLEGMQANKAQLVDPKKRKPAANNASYLALAAGVLLAVSLGFNAALINERNTSGAIKINHQILLEMQRSSQAPTTTTPTESNTLVMIDIGPDAEGEYDVSLMQAGDMFAQFEAVASSDGLVKVVLPSLPVGNYDVEVFDRPKIAPPIVKYRLVVDY